MILKLKSSILIFILGFSFKAFSASGFIVEVGTQACHLKDGAQFCGRTGYTAEKVQLGEVPFQKTFVANELSKPFSFHLTLIVRKNSEGKGYICRVLLKNAEDGSGLGSYSTDVNSLEELNEIKLGSGQVNVSPTESYYGWVKLTRE